MINLDTSFEGITYAQVIMTFISAIATAVIAWIGQRIKKKETQRDEKEAERAAISEAIKEGMQAVLRDRIIQMASFCINQGHTQVYMVENMTHMFTAYRALGGNGAVKYLYGQFMALPVISDEEKGE